LEGQVEILTRQLEVVEEQRQRTIKVSAEEERAKKKTTTLAAEAAAAAATAPQAAAAATVSLNSTNSIPAPGPQMMGGEGLEKEQGSGGDGGSSGDGNGVVSSGSGSAGGGSASELSSLSDAQLFYHAQLHSQLGALQAEKVTVTPPSLFLRFSMFILFRLFSFDRHHLHQLKPKHVQATLLRRLDQSKVRVESLEDQGRKLQRLLQEAESGGAAERLTGRGDTEEVGGVFI
jgi:hypothetical protein